MNPLNLRKIVIQYGETLILRIIILILEEFC